MRVNKIGVHRTHCCILHGCKYSDHDCPVTNAEVLQDHLCEFCNDTFFNLDNEIPEILMKDIKKVFLKENRKLKINKIEKSNK